MEVKEAVDDLIDKLLVHVNRDVHEVLSFKKAKKHHFLVALEHDLLLDSSFGQDLFGNLVPVDQSNKGLNVDREHVEIRVTTGVVDIAELVRLV